MEVLKCRFARWAPLLSAQGRGKNLACRFARWASLLSVGFLGLGCEVSGWSPSPSVNPPQEKAFAIDAVKLIRSDIERGDEASTFGQSVYGLGSQARLLLRYEKLSEKKGILGTQPLKLRVFGVTAGDVAAMRAEGKVCPIASPWMMLATWTAGHPWRGGEWFPGGNLDQNECIVADTPTSDGLCADPGAVCFDLTRWYKIWILERPDSPRNFGFALVTGVPFSLYGETMAAKAPRIQWFEAGERLGFSAEELTKWRAE